MQPLPTEGFRREVHFIPAYDLRDPDPTKNCGVHSVELLFRLFGPKGMMQFVLYTGWHLPHVQQELGDKSRTLSEPMPADLSALRLTPNYDYENERVRTDCPFLGGAPCYYDGTTLGAQEPFDILVRDGEEALWSFLEARYRDWIDPTS